MIPVSASAGVLVFFARLGEFDWHGRRVAMAALARVLRDNPDAVPQFWNTRTPAQMMAIVQQLRVPRGEGYWLAESFLACDLAAQTYIEGALSAHCRAGLARLVADGLEPVEAAAA